MIISECKVNHYENYCSSKTDFDIQVISEQCVKSKGLDGMYAKVLEFIPKHCHILKEVTLAASPG